MARLPGNDTERRESFRISNVPTFPETPFGKTRYRQKDFVTFDRFVNCGTHAKDHVEQILKTWMDGEACKRWTDRLMMRGPPSFSTPNQWRILPSVGRVVGYNQGGFSRAESRKDYRKRILAFRFMKVLYLCNLSIAFSRHVGYVVFERHSSLGPYKTIKSAESFRMAR